MQRQATSIAAEAVGQNDFSAGLYETLMQGPNAVGMRRVPGLGIVPGRQADLEKVGSSRAVGEQGPPFGEKLLQHENPRHKRSARRFKRAIQRPQPLLGICVARGLGLHNLRPARRDLDSARCVL